MITRFSIGTTIGGYEVIDADGRPVTSTLELLDLASQVCDELNAAALRGRKAMARALGAVELVS